MAVIATRTPTGARSYEMLIGGKRIDLILAKLNFFALIFDFHGLFSLSLLRCYSRAKSMYTIL